MSYVVSPKEGYSGFYFKALRSVFLHGCIFLAVVWQLLVPSVHRVAQGIVFDATIYAVSGAQGALLSFVKLVHYLNYVDISGDIKRIEELEKKNEELRGVVYNLEREISALSSVKKIADSFTGKAVGKTATLLCGVRFYLSGVNRTAICYVIGKSDVDIKKNAIVVDHVGLVGRVLQGYAAGEDKSYVRIQLIDDYLFRVPFISASSFERGVVSGNGKDQPLETLYAKAENLLEGELIFTSSDAGVEFFRIVGLIMVCYSGLCAVFSSDLRRIANHCMVVHLGVFVGFCLSGHAVDAGVFGFAVLMSMISMFSIGTGVGVVCVVNGEYAKNIFIGSACYDGKSRAIGIVALSVVVINIAAIFPASSFFADIVMHGNDEFLAFLHMAAKVFCLIAALRILMGAFWFGDTHRGGSPVQERALDMIFWLPALILTIVVTVFVAIYYKAILSVYLSGNSYRWIPSYEKIVWYSLAAVAAYISRRVQSIVGDVRLGFDFVLAYEKLFVPTSRMIRVFITTFYIFFADVGKRVRRVVYREYCGVNKDYLVHSLFYNYGSVWSLLVLVVAILLLMTILILRKYR